MTLFHERFKGAQEHSGARWTSALRTGTYTNKVATPYMYAGDLSLEISW